MDVELEDYLYVLVTVTVLVDAIHMALMRSMITDDATSTSTSDSARRQSSAADERAHRTNVGKWSKRTAAPRPTTRAEAWS